MKQINFNNVKTLIRRDAFDKEGLSRFRWGRILRSNPSAPVAITGIQNHSYQDLRGGNCCHYISYLQGGLDDSENQKTATGSGRNRARK